uniref:Uncharacterized protein n=1 Tax=Rhizophora mucronata TaxID=61149 RepID=A0A2P2N5D9_RHIMU
MVDLIDYKTNIHIYARQLSTQQRRLMLTSNY